MGRMSKLPCPQQHIAQVPEGDRDKCVPYTTLPAACQVRTCGLQATEEHHVVRRSFTRSWAERDYALLYGEVVRVKVPLCSAHHRDCTENRSYFEYAPGEGFVFWTELTEGEAAGVSAEPSLASDIGDSAPPLSESPSVSPGESCPTCQRRVPYPKLPSSPTSAVWSMRMPADAKDDFKGIVDALAAHLGAGEEPYSRYKAVLTAAVYALQVPPERVLSEIGERVA